MSTHATIWAWAQPLPPPEKLILLAMAEGANHQAQCWPTKAMLLHLTSLSEAAVSDGLKALESRSLLRREEVAGGSAKIFLVLENMVPVTQPARREVAAFVPAADLKADMEAAITIWNTMAARTAAGNPAHRLPKVIKLNDANKKRLAARLQEFGIDGWARGVFNVEHSAHCRGVNDQKWKADFTYLLQPKGSMKACNGQWPDDYEERTHGGQRTGPIGRGDQRVDRLRGFDASIRGGSPQGGGRERGGAEGGGQPGADDGGQRSAEDRPALGGPDAR